MIEVTPPETVPSTERQWEFHDMTFRLHIPTGRLCIDLPMERNHDHWVRRSKAVATIAQRVLDAPGQLLPATEMGVGALRGRILPHLNAWDDRNPCPALQTTRRGGK